MQNPKLLAPGGRPEIMNCEQLILQRSGISFSASSDRHKFAGKGDLYLSNLRLVFVSQGNGSLQGFDLPLATISHESFNQPIFGANNLSGTNPPLEGTGLDADINWCIYFNHGGVGTFLPLFFRLMTEMRARMSQPIPPGDVFSPAETQQLVQAAFVDPSDPSKLYVSQPI